MCEHVSCQGNTACLYKAINEATATGNYYRCRYGECLLLFVFFLFFEIQSFIPIWIRRFFFWLFWFLLFVRVAGLTRKCVILVVNCVLQLLFFRSVGTTTNPGACGVNVRTVSSSQEAQ
jgi:hypothetical protein